MTEYREEIGRFDLLEKHIKHHNNKNMVSQVSSTAYADLKLKISFVLINILIKGTIFLLTY